MEKLVLQSDNTDFVAIDTFVRAICEANYINNYFATISVSVTNAVKCAMDGCSDRQDITISFDYCPQGLLFAINCSSKTFVSDEQLFLIRMLVDDVEVKNEGRSLQMIFVVRGIDAQESAHRVSVLNRYYQPAARPELLQL